MFLTFDNGMAGVTTEFARNIGRCPKIWVSQPFIFPLIIANFLDDFGVPPFLGTPPGKFCSPDLILAAFMGDSPT